MENLRAWLANLETRLLTKGEEAFSPAPPTVEYCFCNKPVDEFIMYNSDKVLWKKLSVE